MFAERSRTARRSPEVSPSRTGLNARKTCASTRRLTVHKQARTTMFQNPFRLVGIVGMCCLLPFFTRGKQPNRERDGQQVVAVVNSVPIFYSSVDLPSDTAREQFIFEYGHAPVDESDFHEMEQLRLRYRLKRIASWIRTTVRKQEMARLGVDVSEAEIIARWEQMLQDRDPPETVARTRAGIVALLNALRAVFEQSEDSDHVYETKLIGKVSREEWKMLLRICSTPKRRRIQEKTLEAALDQDGAFDESVRDGVRRLVAWEKLDRAIDEELIRADPEFAEYMRLAKTDPSDEKVQSKGPNYVAAKRYEWWHERYREAKIEIKDERFKDALRLVRERPMRLQQKLTKKP